LVCFDSGLVLVLVEFWFLGFVYHLAPDERVCVLWCDCRLTWWVVVVVVIVDVNDHDVEFYTGSRRAVKREETGKESWFGVGVGLLLLFLHSVT